MDIEFEIENIPRYDWTYSDGMDFNRGVGDYVLWKDAKEIWDALLNRVRTAETVVADVYEALGATGIVNLKAEIWLLQELVKQGTQQLMQLENENENLSNQLAEALAQIDSMWKTIAP